MVEPTKDYLDLFQVADAKFVAAERKDFGKAIEDSKIPLDPEEVAIIHKAGITIGPMSSFVLAKIMFPRSKIEAIKCLKK